MIPMADNLNHSSVDVNQEMVNIQLHLNAAQNDNYFRIGKMLNDYSILFDDSLKTDQNRLNICGRFDRTVYTQNMEFLGTEKVREVLRSTQHQIWEIPHFLDEFSEDNDSDMGDDSSDEEDKFVMVLGEKRRQVKLREGHGLEFFVDMELKYLSKMRNKRSETANEDLYQAYRDLFKNTGFKNDKAVDVLVAKSKKHYNGG